MKPFIYAHELIDNPCGIWIGCADEKVVRDSHTDGETGTEIVALYKRPVELTVWYGTMPESNGKSNWTALLHRKGDVFGGITIERSEYPDRVRYEADRMRFMIGELDEEPCILDYDANLHSDYMGDEHD